MLINYSKNPFLQAFGIVFHNRGRLAIFLIWSSLIVWCHFEFKDEMDMTIPMIPISILGGALAIFLAFRNSSAYDRWWEARKIWGATVNSSRQFASKLLAYSSVDDTAGKVSPQQLKDWQKQLIYRHISWLYALKSFLRREKIDKEVNPWLSEEDRNSIKNKTNIPVHIINIQAQELKRMEREGVIEQFRLFELMHNLEDFYDQQGMCERIKNTVFPFYYNYFTRLFLWVFTICLPFGFVSTLGWVTIPMSVVVSFVFAILEKSGSITEDPFEGRAADIPLQTICRSIEIDLREMINDQGISLPIDKSIGRFRVEYQL